MMKRIFCILTASALLLSLTGCASKAKANSTYSGTVSAISADAITLATDNGDVTIKITANTQMTMGRFGGFGNRDQMSEGEWTKPADGERPERGEKTDRGERPERSEKTEGKSKKPEGNFERPAGDFTMPEGGSFEGFRGNFSGMDISSIPVGTHVTVTTGADKTAATISMSMNFQDFGSQRPNSQN